MLKVNGGPAASGVKLPLKEPLSKVWNCSQGHVNKGYWTRCLTAGCNERRT